MTKLAAHKSTAMLTRRDSAEADSPARLPRGPGRSLSWTSVDPTERIAQRRRGIFLGLSLACIFSQYMLVAFLSPFFPDVAAGLGLSSTMVGVIMAMDSLASAIFSPVVGFQTDRFGVRTVVSVGLAISSATCAFIGFVPHLCSDTTSMAATFIAARLVMGVGGAMVETAAYGTLMHVFKDQKGMVMAAGETVIGLGCIGGPPFGGVMYQLSGTFWLPCVMFGALPLILLLAFAFVQVPSSADAKGSANPELPPELARPFLDEAGPTTARVDALPPGPRKSFIGVLLSGPFLITLSGVFLGSSAYGFIDPTLAPYMKATYGFDAGIAGVFFMIPGLCYVLTAMVAGGLVDTFGGAHAPHQQYRLKFTASVGYVVFVLCFLFLAPAFARPVLERLGLFSASLVALGVGFGLTVIPSFSDLSGIAERGMRPSGPAEESALASQITGVWSSAYQLGQAVGPIMGGVLEYTIGTNWGSFTFAMLCACGAILNAYGAWQANAASAAVLP